MVLRDKYDHEVNIRRSTVTRRTRCCRRMTSRFGCGIVLLWNFVLFVFAIGILLSSYCQRMTGRLEGGDCLTLECLCPCHLRSIWNLQTSPLQWVSARPKVFCVNLVLSHFGIDLTKSKHFGLNQWGLSHFGTSSVLSLCTSPPPSYPSDSANEWIHLQTSPLQWFWPLCPIILSA